MVFRVYDSKVAEVGLITDGPYINYIELTGVGYTDEKLSLTALKKECIATIEAILKNPDLLIKMFEYHNECSRKASSGQEYKWIMPLEIFNR